MFHLLESRRMFAANLLRGSLSVIGSEGDDQILLRDEGDSIVVSLNGNVSRFDRARVYGIAVRGLGGNDRISATRFSSSIAVTGDGGNDTILGTKKGDSLFGGSGNDSIGGYAGDDYLDGQSGDDTLISAAGIDVIHGGRGNDRSESRGVFIGSGVEEVVVSKSDPLGVGAMEVRGEIVSISESEIAIDWKAVFPNNLRDFTLEPTHSRKFKTNSANTFDFNAVSTNDEFVTGVYGVVRGPIATTIDRTKYNDPIRLYTGATTLTLRDDFLSGEAALVFRSDVPANVDDVSLWRKDDHLMLDVGMTFGSGSTFVGLGDAIREESTYNLTAVAGYAGFGTADMYYPMATADLGRVRLGKLTFNIKQGTGGIYTKTVKIDAFFKGERLGRGEGFGTPTSIGFPVH